MRQRVMIAIALACEPQLILCDEPTTALDVTIQDQILKLLAAMRQDFGVSVVFVTHDLAVVAETCSRIAVMYAGQVVETGTVDQVFHEPHHPYTLGLLRSVPRFDLVRQQLSSIPGQPPDLVVPPSGCRFHPRCPKAAPVCAVEYPPLIPRLTDPPTHEAACHFPVADNEDLALARPTLAPEARIVVEPGALST
jgi:oligopeptide/dipeptide ABC transporter ATP-binding protein